MAEFGAASKAKLETCHPLIRRIAEEGIRYVDFTVLHLGAWRSAEVQNELFQSGKSKVEWPKSKHNYVATEEDVAAGYAPHVGAPLSRAIDVAMWHPDQPHVKWERRGEFYMLGGFLRGIGEMLLPEGWSVRLGADWDRDGYTDDQTFHDLPHVELIEGSR